jgi:YfiH family protein
VTLNHGLLEECRVEHGFGTRASVLPEGLRLPRQMHGDVVVPARLCAAPPAPEADGVVSDEAGIRVGIVTADCVPILLASRNGGAVAALHAGWRGLARGIVDAGVRSLRKIADSEESLVAVVGPRIGACCYEVDAPVLTLLERSFGRDLSSALRSGRPGHAFLDLGRLAVVALERASLEGSSIAEMTDVCTHCDAERFFSYRRDGPRAGRLVHFIAARET